MFDIKTHTTVVSCCSTYSCLHELVILFNWINEHRGFDFERTFRFLCAKKIWQTHHPSRLYFGKAVTQDHPKCWPGNCSLGRPMRLSLFISLFNYKVSIINVHTRNIMQTHSLQTDFNTHEWILNFCPPFVYHSEWKPLNMPPGTKHPTWKQRLSLVSLLINVCN